MKKKILLLHLCDMSEKEKEMLQYFYKYAAKNDVDEVVLFVERIWTRKKTAGEEFKDFVDSIPGKASLPSEMEIKTHLFLDSGDSFYLCANDYNKALVGREDLEIILDCMFEASFDNTKLYFNNYTLNDVDDEMVFRNDYFYVFISYKKPMFDKRAAVFGRKIIYVGPFNDENNYCGVVIELAKESSGKTELQYDRISFNESNGFQREKM